MKRWNYLVSTDILVGCMLLAPAIAQVTDYNQPDSWAAHPMKVMLDMRFAPSFTLVNPDTSLGAMVTVGYDTTSDYDIFCVHPTLLIEPGAPAHNTSISPEYRAGANLAYKWLFSQFAQFGRIYAPYYRQANFFTFFSPNQNQQARVLESAAADVMAAFEFYMQNNNHGKKVILVGHSQGAYLLAMVLRQLEAGTQQQQAYLEQIFLSVLVGMIGGPFVENGALTGGWWQTIPVCQNPLDTGCVMSWATFKNDDLPFPIGQKNNLVFNDVLVSKGLMYTTFDSLSHSIVMDPLGFLPVKPVAYSIYPRDHEFYSTHSAYGVSTDFIGYTKMYRGRISHPNPSSFRLLIENIQDENDLRADPLDGSRTHSLHSYDMYVAIGDVINLIRQKIAQIPTSVDAAPDPKHQTPGSFILEQNYPNPFNPQTTIPYYLARSGSVTLRIHNLLGQTVRTLVQERQEPGRHAVTWDGKNDAGEFVTSGMYFYKLKIDNSVSATRKLILMR